MRRGADWESRALFTRTMSCCGMPSVMHTTSGSSASTHSMMALAANGGGTNTTDASHAASFLASATELNTGRPRCVWPPLPGDTPPTICVPYSIACFEWKVPCLPVKPWQMTRVFLSIQTFAVDEKRPIILLLHPTVRDIILYKL